MTFRGFAALAAAALAASAASAQTIDKAEVTEKVRALGLALGNAYACTPQEERGLFKEETHHMFDLIVQDVGSDLGFLFATALGYGGAAQAETLDCPKLLEQWQGIREEYDLIAEAE